MDILIKWFDINIHQLKKCVMKQQNYVEKNSSSFTRKKLNVTLFIISLALLLTCWCKRVKSSQLRWFDALLICQMLFTPSSHQHMLIDDMKCLDIPWKLNNRTKTKFFLVFQLFFSASYKYFPWNLSYGVYLIMMKVLSSGNKLIDWLLLSIDLL